MLMICMCPIRKQHVRVNLYDAYLGMSYQNKSDDQLVLPYKGRLRTTVVGCHKRDFSSVSLIRTRLCTPPTRSSYSIHQQLRITNIKDL